MNTKVCDMCIFKKMKKRKEKVEAILLLYDKPNVEISTKQKTPKV